MLSGKIVDRITIADNLSDEEALKSYSTFLRILALLAFDGYKVKVIGKHFEMPEEIEFNKMVATEIFEINMTLMKYGQVTKVMLRYFNDNMGQTWICEIMEMKQNEICTLKTNAIAKANKWNPKLKKLIYIENLIAFLNLAA